MEHIFLELLNRSIAAGWVVLAVIILRRLLWKAPKWTICLLWVLVAVRLACPFSLKSAFSLIPSNETVRYDAADLDKAFVDSGVRFVDETVNPILHRSFDSTAASGAALSQGADADFVGGADTGMNPIEYILFVASVIWMAGMGILILYALAGYIRLRRKVQTAVRLQSMVYMSEFVDTPFILGVWKPRVYLPSGMPEEMRSPVLAHEQAHLKRRDNLWKMFGYMLLCVYWFHPFIWIAYSLLCKDIELACDERVIKDYDVRGRRMYSEALLACSIDRRTVLACPLAFGEVGVKERIKSVISYKKPAFWVVAAAVAACIVAAVCFLTDPTDSAEDSGKILSADANAGNGIDGGYVQQDRNEADSGKVGDGWNSSEVGEDAGGIGSDESGDDRGAIGGDGTGNSATGNSTAGNSENAAAVDSASLETFVNAWAKAFVSRDGYAIQSLVSEEVASSLEERDMLSGPQGQRSFGLSSPWPEDVERDMAIRDIDSENAVIYYYAWTSEPHVTVWMEYISYQKQDEGYRVTDEELVWMDDISSAEAFSEAYGYYGIDGSAMDYEAGGAGEALQSNAMLSSTMDYRDLFEPETAARRLLNLSEDSSKVTITRGYEDENVVNLEIKLEENYPLWVSMVQPYGPEGIWVPKDYKVDIMARLMRVDWNEIRSRHLPVIDWVGILTDVVCIAEVPEEGIRLYGYNDIEWSGQGVAIDMGDNVHLFDWIYISPRTIMPECYWNKADRQLQVALNIYTGTGAAAQELHVLQYDETGALQDYAFELNDYSDMLQERIGFAIEEETGRLKLFDKRDQKELALVGIEEDMVESLELGMISRFYLGESITLLVEPGYFTEDAAIAGYPEGMPALEVEVLLLESEGEIQFGLGEIGVIFQ